MEMSDARVSTAAAQDELGTQPVASTSASPASGNSTPGAHALEASHMPTELPEELVFKLRVSWRGQKQEIVIRELDTVSLSSPPLSCGLRWWWGRLQRPPRRASAVVLCGPKLSTRKPADTVCVTPRTRLATSSSSCGASRRSRPHARRLSGSSRASCRATSRRSSSSVWEQPPRARSRSAC